MQEEKSGAWMVGKERERGGGGGKRNGVDGIFTEKNINMGYYSPELRSVGWLAVPLIYRLGL